MKHKKKIIFTIFIMLLYIIAINFLYKKQDYFPAKNELNSENNGVVVVLHGIKKDNRITYLLSKRISNSGFEVYNISYPYKKLSIQEIAHFLNDKIMELNLEDKELNLVGHSMGGLVIKNYMSKYKPTNIKNVVMIATPNKGSELADELKDWKLYKLMFGDVASRQLGTDLYNLQKEYNVDYNLGIIAGNFSLNPVFSKMLAGEDDGIVSVNSTKIEGVDKHITLKFPHTIGIMMSSIADEVIYFLKNGDFKKTELLK